MKRNEGKAGVILLIIVLILMMACAATYGYLYVTKLENRIIELENNKNSKTKIEENLQSEQKTEKIAEENNTEKSLLEQICEIIDKNNDNKYVINEISIFNGDIQREKDIPEKYKNDNIIFGCFKASQLYDEEPQLAGGGFDIVKTDEGVWVIWLGQYFAYDKTTGKIISVSPSLDMSI